MPIDDREPSVTTTTPTGDRFVLIESDAGFEPRHVEEIRRVAAELGVDLVDRIQAADDAVTYLVLDAVAEIDAVRGAVASRGIPTRSVSIVHLVGDRPGADDPGYLVEWDLPEGLDMETYLARKATRAPIYDTLDDVAFRRTYVREDMEKCLCLYDGGCEEDVIEARSAVDTPIDRLHHLGGSS